jgi:ubiquinone/menaquinone biosynthesis C-methylase UbiE
MSNDDQIDSWNGKAGETWARMQERMDRTLSPVTAALLTLAAPQPGEHVLDVGCGTGETSLALAGAVGDEGTVLGLDVSEPMLARARERADELLSEAEFRAADASTFADDDDFDLLMSRFGVMFFNDPAAAFTNLHARATPGGRLCFACWQPSSENPWATLPMQTLAHLLPPVEPADPLAPGPFAFADPDRVRKILSDSGWQDIAIQALPFTMIVGEGDDPIAAAVHFNLRIGPAARLVRDAGPDVEAPAKSALAKALAAYLVDGQVGLPGAVWLVSARA